MSAAEAVKPTAGPVHIGEYGELLDSNGREVVVYGMSLTNNSAATANRDLLRDAINVHAACGKTPRQLADEVARLRTAHDAAVDQRFTVEEERNLLAERCVALADEVERLTRERDSLLAAAKIVEDCRNGCISSEWNALAAAIHQCEGAKA